MKKLNPDKQSAFDILRTGNNVFLTGAAGSGKTFLLNYYIDYLKDRGINVAVTAPTGIAATHIGGQTIHSWSGLGINQNITDEQLSAMESKKYLWDRFEKVKVLIIDEVSMLHRQTLNDVEKVLRFFKRKDKPFGGIQVIFSGDFFQLPPVSRTGEHSYERFAFMSGVWSEAEPKICYLQKQYRQNDEELSQLLEGMRIGRVSEESIHFLESCKERTFDDYIFPVKLFTHNIDVDRINDEELEKLDGFGKTFFAKTSGKKPLIEALKKSVLAGENLKIKIGAKVIFVKNNYEKGYINGTMGEVVDFSMSGNPVVLTTDGKRIVADIVTWSIDDEKGKSLASYSQIPLRLAWAITVHKSQGMTLDAMEVDLSKSFERGQGYVALSRVRGFSGLRLLGYNEIALKLDELALEADKRFRALSLEAIEEIERQENIEKISDEFTLSCGGLVTDKEISKNRVKRTSGVGKVIGISTYLKTKALIKEGKSVEEIAEERDFSEKTIWRHIKKLRKDFPDLDLERFRPDKKLFEKVEEAFDKLQKRKNRDDFDLGGSLKLRPIFEELNEEVDYDDIKRVVLFLE